MSADKVKEGCWSLIRIYLLPLTLSKHCGRQFPPARSVHDIFLKRPLNELMWSSLWEDTTPGCRSATAQTIRTRTLSVHGSAISLQPISCAPGGHVIWDLNSSSGASWRRDPAPLTQMSVLTLSCTMEASEGQFSKGQFLCSWEKRSRAN